LGRFGRGSFGHFNFFSAKCRRANPNKNPVYATYFLRAQKQEFTETQINKERKITREKDIVIQMPNLNLLPMLPEGNGINLT
jgi:hypothetical protein